MQAIARNFALVSLLLVVQCVQAENVYIAFATSDSGASLHFNGETTSGTVELGSVDVFAIDGAYLLTFSTTPGEGAEMTLINLREEQVQWSRHLDLELARHMLLKKNAALDVRAGLAYVLSYDPENVGQLSLNRLNLNTEQVQSFALQPEHKAVRLVKYCESLVLISKRGNIFEVSAWPNGADPTIITRTLPSPMDTTGAPFRNTLPFLAGCGNNASAWIFSLDGAIVGNVIRAAIEAPEIYLEGQARNLSQYRMSVTSLNITEDDKCFFANHQSRAVGVLDLETFQVTELFNYGPAYSNVIVLR